MKSNHLADNLDCAKKDIFEAHKKIAFFTTCVTMDQTDLVQHNYSTMRCIGGLSDALGGEKCMHATKHLFKAHRYTCEEDLLCEGKSR